MKVTMISKEFPPKVYGGAGVHIDNLANNLKKLMKVEVRYFGEYNSWEENLKVKGYRGWGRMMKSDCQDGEKFTASLDTLSVNLSMVRDKIDSDIVHTHTWYAGIGGFLAKMLYTVPFVATCHSLEPLRPWKRDQLGPGFEVSTWCERMMLENSDKIIAVSREMKNDILRYFKLPEEKIEVIYNGIDLNLWHKMDMDEDFKKERGIQDEYILFVGRPTRQKGMEYLIDAADMIKPGVQIVFAAVGADTKEYEDEMKRKVKEKNNILWINEALDRQYYIQLYSNALMFVCPSIYEPFGITNLEAMACEIPVVASATGGIKEVVLHEKTGLFVEPGNGKAIAEAVNTMLDDRKKAKAMGIEGRRRVEEIFSWETIARQTKALYEKVLEEVKR